MLLLATAILFSLNFSTSLLILLSLVIFLSKRDFITIFFKSFDFTVDSFAFSTKICVSFEVSPKCSWLSWNQILSHPVHVLKPSCLILCLYLTGESVFCLLSASSGWFSLSLSSLSFRFPKKNEVKDDCRPVSVILFSVSNENNSQNHCRFNIRLKTRRLKHSEDCNTIKATWNETQDFNWDHYPSWENKVNFPTSFEKWMPVGREW